MESKNKNFWLIVIQEKEIVVSLVSYTDHGLQIRGIGEKQIWSGADEKELISAVDMSLNTCSEICHLTEDQEPDDIAFVVSPFWIDENGEIISPKAKFLEKLCSQFDFKPLGFIVDDEAIAQNTDQKDSISNSFILIHLSSTQYRLSLIHLGKIKARAKYSYTGDLTPKDLEESISSLKTDITLPPQIIFWGKTDPTLEDQMLNYPWTGKRTTSGFLHFPQIKLLDDQDLFHIFSKVVIQEMNQSAQPPKESLKVEEVEIGEKQETESEEEEKTPPEETEDQPESSFSKPERADFGFISADISKFPSASENPDIISSQKSEIPVLSTPSEDNKLTSPVQPSLIESEAPVSPFPTPKKKISFKFPKIKLPHLSLPSSFKKKPVFLILFLILPLLVLALFWYFIPQAEITLYIKPEPLEFNTQATFDSQIQSIDQENSVIPVKELSFSITETQEIPSTGEATIGEKAKGEVKIQNRTDQRVTFPKATVVSTESGASFYLTSEVSVASKTPDFESGTDQWGETKAMLEAVDIGSAHNLSQNTRLTIGDYTESQFIVTTTESFSGGYAETVQAVSKEDHQNLENLLISAMEEKLPQILPDKTSPQDLLLKNSTQTKVEDIEYSREIGEKAQVLSATATLNVTLKLLDQSTQKQIIETFLNPTLPPDLLVNPDSIDIVISEDQISITASAIPQIDIESVKNSLLGLSAPKADALLRSLPRVYRYTTFLNPELPSFVKTMPHFIQKIKLNLEY